LLSCLRLLFIMGRKGGFSCPGGEQKLLMELFCENNAESRLLFSCLGEEQNILMDVFCDESKNMAIIMTC
ncbi:hypothetical protein, partial [Parageobacillus toebii]|uniref:hypothetical protein n=1 Tax=Parageobacillus toebii TaxID=153151 RepID=UPI001C85BA8B